MRLTGLPALLLALAGFAADAGAQDRPFYFRLDTGYSMSQKAAFHDRGPDPFLGFLVCGNPACNTPMSINHLGNSAIAGAGIGWRFTPQLRADLTVGLRSFKLRGIDQFPESIAANVNSAVTMLTGYWDIPWEGRFKPFVGAGIGQARNRTSMLNETFLALPGTIQITPGAATSTAMSLSAGVAFQAWQGVTLEVGYRYIDLGKFQTGTGIPTVLPGLVVPYVGAEGKLRSNEITVGLLF